LAGLYGPKLSYLPMKPLLLVLLALSLAANLVLALRAQRLSPPVGTASGTTQTGADARLAPAPGSSAATNAASSSADKMGAAPGTAAAIIPHAWRAATSDQDLHRLVADLRAAGYPASVVRAVVNQLLNERFASRNPSAGQPFWKQGAPTPEMLAAQNALTHERQALLETLLGVDARPSAVLDGYTRQRRYGDLSDEKIDTIARIERDYGELNAETWARRRGNAATSMEATMQAQHLMEQEKLADLAAVLTPDELAQYEQRNSPSARTLINNLRNVEVSESEYAMIYAAQKSFDAANPTRGSMDGATYAQRLSAQLALSEQVRSVLGDTRFYSYLEGADQNYAQVARALGSFPTVTPPTLYQVYQLQIELQGVMVQSSRDGPPPPEKIAEMRTTVENYNQRLESLVGAAAAEVYRKQGAGRMFMNFRQAPNTAQPAGR
jgi:hypothetical protein